MRIWAFPSFYPYEQYGEKWKGIFAHRQYQGLIENGAELSVIIPVNWKPIYPLSQLHGNWSKVKSYPIAREYDGIKVYHPRVPNMLPYALDKRSYEEKYYQAVASFFKSNNIILDPARDIFFSQWLPESVYVQYTAHRLGLKSAILSIGDDVVVWPVQNSKAMPVFDDLLTRADVRFTCADYLGREANKMLGKNLPYEVIHWGVDYNVFKPATAEEKKAIRAKYKLPQDRVLVLNVGTAIARKGWLDLFEAAGNIKAQANAFSIVAVHAGEPDFDLDEEAAKRGVRDMLVNLGQVPPAGVNEIYRAVDIFCLPSHWEGMANANIEAMSSGLPVITTDVCGHPELISDTITGMLIPPKRPDLLAAALMPLVNDVGKRSMLGQNARNFIVNEWGNFKYNSEKIYKTLDAVLRHK